MTLLKNKTRRDMSKFMKEGWPELILIAIFILSTMVVLTPRIQTNDDIGYYAQTRSMVIDKDLDLENEFWHYKNQSAIFNIEADPDTGKYYSQYPLGVSMLELPFTYIGHIFAGIIGEEQDGYSWPYIYFTCLGSSIYGFLGLLTIFYLLKEWYGKQIAFIATTSIWLTTALYFYMFLQSSVSHSFSFFVTTIFLVFWIRSITRRKKFRLKQVLERKPRTFFILGILAGFMTLVRYTDGILVLFLVIEFFYLIKLLIKRKKDEKIVPLFSRYLISLAAFLMVLAPQFILVAYQHHNLNILGYYDGSFDFSKSIIQFPLILFSSWHGVFYWHPILFVGLLGLIWGINKRSRDGKWFYFVNIIMFIIFTYLVSSWGRSAFGAQSFGHRFFVSLYPILAIGLANVIYRIKESMQRRYKFDQKTIFMMIYTFIFILTAWNFGLMIQYGSRMIPSIGPVSFKEMLYNNLQRLPEEIFNILKRFLFNRDSLV